jgi:hypothetical protein
MGLDMYVRIKKDTEESVDIWYGRKLNEIHGWMQRTSGIEAEAFNCHSYALTADILDAFEADISHLNPTEGFFFGRPNDIDVVMEAANDLITASRTALLCGKTPYYFSWF